MNNKYRKEEGEFVATKQWYSDAYLKNLCFCSIILGGIAVTYALILATIFFVNSHAWNSNFLEVLSLEQQILDQTSLAIRDVHTVSNKTNQFITENPNFLSTIQDTIRSFSTFMDSDASAHLLHVLDWFELFLNTNSEDINQIVKDTHNITHFIMEFKRTLEEKRKVEIAF